MDWVEFIAAALECDWPIGLPFLPAETRNSRVGGSLILLRLNQPDHSNQKPASNHIVDAENFTERGD
jgi:hypothetical protein